jgi:hypothetical protein
MVGEHDRDVQRPAVAQGKPAAHERVLDVQDVHRLQQLPGCRAVADGKVVVGAGDRQAA